MVFGKQRGRPSGLWTLLPLALLLGLLALPASASAQSVCVEYPNLPICDTGNEGGDDDGDPTGAGPTANLGGGGDGNGDGELPFTGQPLTPLLLLLLALLVTGLAIRAGLAIHRRIATGGDSPRLT
jgi:hypothetical protein